MKRKYAHVHPVMIAARTALIERTGLQSSEWRNIQGQRKSRRIQKSIAERMKP